MASTTDNDMAPAVDNTMTSTDESILEAIRSQILSTQTSPNTGTQSWLYTVNLRVIRPDVENPSIATDFVPSTHCSSATVWDDENEVLFSTIAYDENAVAAMRFMLRLISTEVRVKVQKWMEENTARAVLVQDGIKYIWFSESMSNWSSLRGVLTNLV
jgi:hypothetical protein